MSDDSLLELTQTIRKEIITDLTPNGKMPIDNKERLALLATLNDMDKQVVNKKRLSIDSKAADNAQLVADAVTRITDMFDGRDPYKRVDGLGSIPMPDSNLIPECIPVPGETDQDLSNETYDSFEARHAKPKRTSGIESE